MVRIKYRYIAFHFKLANRHLALTNADLLNQILLQVKMLHGEHGFGLVARYVRLIYWNRDTELLVLRSSRASHQQLVTAAVLLSEISDTQVSLTPLRISGTLRCTAKFLRRYILRLPEVIESDAILKEIKEVLFREGEQNTTD